MKNLLAVLTISFMLINFASTPLHSQSADAEITQALQSFAQAADANSVDDLEKLLATSFRIVWPQPDAEPFIVDRSTYLDKIKSKEWGGDNRDVKIHWIKTNGDHGTAYVQLTGKAEMHSFLDVVKIKGNWQICQDAVQMK